MTTPQLDRLAAHCQRLRLHRVQAELPSLLEQAAKKDVSYADFLDDVLTREVQSKTEKHLAMRVAMARFPFQKTLEGFDWKFQPSIEPKVIKALATGRFIADGESVLLLGPPGVGKTHPSARPTSPPSARSVPMTPITRLYQLPYNTPSASCRVCSLSAARANNCHDREATRCE